MTRYPTMFIGFSKFIRENDATVAYVDDGRVSANNSTTEKDSGTWKNSQNSNFVLQDDIRAKVSNLVKSILLIDPFFEQRQHLNLMGTPNFISPEMSTGQAAHDEDRLTDFFLSIKRHHPEAAAYVRPLIPLLKKFYTSISAAIAQAKNENVEMMYRLDNRAAKTLRQAVTKIKESIDQFTAQDMRVLGDQFRQAFKQFDQFYNMFQNTFHHVEQHIGDAYGKVKHLAWDTTRDL